MKKRIIYICIAIITFIILSIISIEIFKPNSIELSKDICDYSWERYTDVDLETIRFGCDNTFSYFYAVGDPVEDSDLCEKYSYDGNVIKLICDGSRYDDKIKIISYDEDKLIILKNDEERTFEKIK